MTLTTFLLLLLVITINSCIIVIILDKKEVKCEIKSDVPYWISALSNNIPLFSQKHYVDEFNISYTTLLTLKEPIEKKINKNIIEGKHNLIVVHTLMLPLIVANGINNVSGITKKLNVKGVKTIGSNNINIDEVIVL